MPRTRTFTPDTVIDVALDLFWRKGYKKCSMADVVRKSGVARYGLYQTFKDKDQLYCAALRRYHKKLRKLFIEPFCNSGQKLDFNTLVEHFDRILYHLEKGDHDGCFAHQAAIERGSDNEEVRQIVNEIFTENKEAFRMLIKNGLASGQIRELPLDDLVTYVMGVERGLIAMTKQKCSLDERREYVRCALQLLKPD